MSLPHETKARDVKTVLLGDTGVGKTSVVLRFCTHNFKPYSESTIGASFMSKMMVVDGVSYKLQIWDTAGQERYHSLAPLYYRGAAAAILVYDISNMQSFVTLKDWVAELQSQAPREMVLAIAGNKSDLDGSREVETSIAQKYADDVGACFLETSAKDDNGIRDIFTQVVKRLPVPKPRNEGTIGLQVPQQKSSMPGCC